MKQIARSFMVLSRVERMGYIAFSCLLLLLLLTWQTMPYWVPAPDTDEIGDARLMALYRGYVQQHPVIRDDVPAALYKPGAPLFMFDPNTLDSAGFLQLGLTPKIVKGLMNWRRHGKHFYKKEDLQPLYHLTPEMYARLAPYIRIADDAPRPAFYGGGFQKLPPLPATIDLNITDSATLVRLNGIGPALAHRIVSRRAALGGFIDYGQLKEVYKFSDSTFAYLQQKLMIRAGTVKKIAVNSAGVADLQAHPYIGEKMAKNIILYRDALKRFDNITQLRQVPLMNEENYRKIAPYLTID